MSKEPETPETPAVQTWYVGGDSANESVKQPAASPTPAAEDHNNDALIAGDSLGEGLDDDFGTGGSSTRDVVGDTNPVVSSKDDRIETAIVPDHEDGSVAFADASPTIAAPVAVDIPNKTVEDSVENTATRRYGILTGKPEEPEGNEQPEPQWSNVQKTEQIPVEAIRPKTEDERQKEFEDTIFEGATVKPSVPSRAAAHAWTLVLSLIFVPITWYLALDAMTRLRNPDISPWMNGSALPLDIGAEFVGAGILLLLVVWMARYSSLGTFVSGLLVTAAGVPFVFLPAQTHNFLQGFLEAMTRAGEQGRFYQALPANIAHNIEVSGSSGLLLLAGIALLALGFVSHGARRKGRKDYLIQKKVAAGAAREGTSSLSGADRYYAQMAGEDSHELSRAERKAAKRAAKKAKRG